MTKDEQLEECKYILERISQFALIKRDLIDVTFTRPTWDRLINILEVLNMPR